MRVAHEGTRLPEVRGPCVEGLATIAADAGSVLPLFDYIMTREDLEHGQRIANYSVEYQLRSRPGVRGRLCIGWTAQFMYKRLLLRPRPSPCPNSLRFEHSQLRL